MSELLKPILRPLLAPLTSAITAALGGFNPLSLFNDGSIGVLYDNNDLTSFYLDAAGTTPATVNGLVGLQLDKSQGLVLGAELTNNGDFSNGTTGWTGVNATLAASAGALQITAVGGAQARASQTITTVAGKWYEARAQIWRGTGAGSVDLLITGIAQSALVTATVPTEAVVRFLATSASTTIRVGSAGSPLAGETYFADNVSVKELPGNHRYQTTTGSKPVLRGTPTGGNLVTNGDFASDTWWTKGADWVISGGVASRGTSATFSNLSRSALLTIGNVYRIELDIVAISGTVNILCGSGGGASIQAFTTTGRKVAYLPCSGDTAFYIQAGNAATTCTIDNVTIHDVSAGSVTAPYGLQYDGVDDFLQTASVNFSATDKMFVCAGVRSLPVTSTGKVVELGTNATTVAGTFCLDVDSVAGNPFAVRAFGSATGIKAENSATSPRLSVVSTVIDIAKATTAEEVVIRVNGAEPPQTAFGGPAGTGNFTSNPLYFGRRAGASLPFNGLDFGFVIVGKTLTASQISSTERWMAQRTGVSI